MPDESCTSTHDRGKCGPKDNNQAPQISGAALQECERQRDTNRNEPTRHASPKNAAAVDG